MKTAKKKKASSTLHTSRTRVESSRIAHDKKVERIKADTAQTAIIGVILGAMLVVVVGVLAIQFAKPERQVADKVSALASNYYENSLYKSVTDEGANKDVLKKYTETGFAPVTLRQLLLFKSYTDTKESKYLNRYCSDEATRVTYYPKEPYGVKDYTVEYQYSCSF